MQVITEVEKCIIYGWITERQQQPVLKDSAMLQGRLLLKIKATMMMTDLDTIIQENSGSTLKSKMLYSLLIGKQAGKQAPSVQSLYESKRELVINELDRERSLQAPEEQMSGRSLP